MKESSQRIRVCLGKRIANFDSLDESILGGARINSFLNDYFPSFFAECPQFFFE
jgi:hypothetical protein